MPRFEPLSFSVVVVVCKVALKVDKPSRSVYGYTEHDSIRESEWRNSIDYKDRYGVQLRSS